MRVALPFTVLSSTDRKSHVRPNVVYAVACLKTSQ